MRENFPLSSGEGAPKGAGERLCSWSSGFLLPWGSISQDCIEDCEEFSTDCGEDNLLGFACIEEFQGKGLEVGIMTRSCHGSEEEHSAWDGSATSNHAVAAPLSRLSGPWREACKGSDLSSVERAKLGHFGEKGASNDLANPRNRTEQLLAFAPQGRGLDHAVNRVIEAGEFRFKRCDDAANALLHVLLGDHAKGPVFFRRGLSGILCAGP
jgi:hypothetical protein